MTFGVVICHEGFRYPETVRWAARRGAQVVFHPHAHVAEPGSHRPTSFAEPANSFHEKAMLCRAAENTCYFASVNFASEGSGTTSAIVRPDGTLQCFQPYGLEGLLVADLDLDAASGRLASRCRASSMYEDAQMRDEDALELALHRALRGEVPPSVRAIVATGLSASSIALDIFCSRPDELAAFEEVVESELEVQLEGVAPKLVCRFLPFEAFSIDASVRLIYDTPWAIE